MTNAQTDAMNKIEEIMREHFEAGVLIVVTELENRQTATSFNYHGGLATCYGLTAYAQLKLEKTISE